MLIYIIVKRKPHIIEVLYTHKLQIKSMCICIPIYVSIVQINTLCNRTT